MKRHRSRWQPQNAPCLICGATQPPRRAGFGYNNFTSQGNLTSFNMFSTNLGGQQGSNLPNGDQIDAVPYSGALLEALGLSFAVAIDINTASNHETLTAFQLIDLSKPAGSRIIFDFTGSLALPDINNGNGKGDYLISGFDLLAAGVLPGDNLIFHAAWNNASDGAESFYIVPTLAVPGPIVGAGLPGILAFLSGLVMFGLNRWRKFRDDGPTWMVGLT